MTDNAEQATRMRAMWSAVALTAINDAIHHTATESKKHKGQALNNLALWANSRNGREVLGLAGINPDKRVTDSVVAFAAKGVPTTKPRTYGCREGCSVTERVCKWCGGGMEGKQGSALYCSGKCRVASWSKANAKLRAQQKREYRKANAERLAQQDLEYRKVNAKRRREYNKVNAERIAEYQREYRKANAEQLAQQNLKYRKVNAERLAELQREYHNTRLATASTLRLAHTISQLKGTTNGTHEPE